MNRQQNSLTDVSRFDRLIYWLYWMVTNNRKLIIGIMSGFLIGRFVNEMSVPNAGVWDVLKGMFSVSVRPVNLFAWFALILLLLEPTIYRLFVNLYTKRRYEAKFAELVKRRKHESITPFSALGWGQTLSLQTCPELRRGWPLSKIKLHHSTKIFSMPNEYKEAYEQYFEKNYQEKRFFDDRTKYMLTQNPIAFSDSPTLILNVQECKYSQFLFYFDNVLKLENKRASFVREVVEGHVNFPHLFCMHAVVITSDYKVLITKRSGKVVFYPGTWSCSIEEQLAEQDLQGGVDRTVLNWGKRMLREELGLSDETYNEENLRVLSVFIETIGCSLNLCALIFLDIESTYLDKILNAMPRTDYEFTEWTFLGFEELIDELFSRTRDYNPVSSGYRMLLATIWRYGEPKAAEIFFRLSKDNW